MLLAKGQKYRQNQSYLNLISFSIPMMDSIPDSNIIKIQSPPFTNIINHHIQKYCTDDLKDTIKPAKLRKELLETHPPKFQHRWKDDSEINERTLKKGSYKERGEIATLKIIQERPLDAVIDSAVNPQFGFSTGFGGEVYKIIDCLLDFHEIKKVFLEQSSKKKLLMSQNTEEFVTVKKTLYASCRCIIKMWMSNDSDAIVYQLRLSGKKRRAKLILVQGDQAEFKIFSFNLLKKLLNKKMISLTDSERVELFYSEHSGAIDYYKKQYNRLIAKRSKLRKVDEKYIQDLLLGIKKQNDELKCSLTKCQEIQYNVTLNSQLEELCFKQSNIVALYDAYFENQHQHFQRKRIILLQKYTLLDIFKHLQISQHYIQFKRRKESKRGKEMQQLPYFPAIRYLQQLGNVSSPHLMMQKLILFHQNTKSCYRDYFINMMKISGMDDYLPITIFCILAMDSENINLFSLTRMLLSYLSEESEYQWQKKILTNIQAALDYICREWGMLV